MTVSYHQWNLQMILKQDINIFLDKAAFPPESNASYFRLLYSCKIRLNNQFPPRKYGSVKNYLFFIV